MTGRLPSASFGNTPCRVPRAPAALCRLTIGWLTSGVANELLHAVMASSGWIILIFRLEPMHMGHHVYVLGYFPSVGTNAYRAIKMVRPPASQPQMCLKVAFLLIMVFHMILIIREYVVLINVSSAPNVGNKINVVNGTLICPYQRFSQSNSSRNLTLSPRLLVEPLV